jgi:KDO2-lipid IV(A) lauroyltransferase
MKKLRNIIELFFVKLAFWCFSRMSLPQASNIGAKIACLIGPNLKVNHIAHTNLKIAFPALSKTERDKIIFAMWDNLGRVFAEFPHVYNLTTEEFNHYVEVEGRENLAMVKEQGGILFSAHMANWELAPRIPADYGINIQLIYRPANNKDVDEIICRERNKRNVGIISKGSRDIKKIIIALQNKKAIGMLLDQKMNEGMSVPFFGRDAMTSTTIAKLALKFNCPIIPTQVTRLGKGPYFKVTILPPLIIKPTIEEILLDINQLIEQWITEHPHEWFWLHKRWGKSIYTHYHPRKIS